ncbi:MAG: hypothetical protein ACK521_03970 [bacterium]
MDLIMTMYSPFKPASQRVKWYMCFSSLFPLLFVGVIYFSTDIGGDCINLYYSPYNELTATAKIQN